MPNIFPKVIYIKITWVKVIKSRYLQRNRNIAFLEGSVGTGVLMVLSTNHLTVTSFIFQINHALQYIYTFNCMVQGHVQIVAIYNLVQCKKEA